MFYFDIIIIFLFSPPFHSFTLSIGFLFLHILLRLPLAHFHQVRAVSRIGNSVSFRTLVVYTGDSEVPPPI